jgi:uncharacterized surface protein with fasciclin (FAS1) repeats
MSLIQNTAELSTLQTAATAAATLSLLQGQEITPMTVFAPSNAAFAKIQSTVDSLLLPENQAKLSQVDLYSNIRSKMLMCECSAGDSASCGARALCFFRLESWW